MSTTLKNCRKALRNSPSVWAALSTRLYGDKTPSTGIPCSDEGECPKSCPEENPTCPKPCLEEASCPEICPEENECPSKDESVEEEEECEKEEECEEEGESDKEECEESDEMDVPGLSTAVLCVPESEVGPGASKCGEYKNPEYFSFHRMSYHEAEVEMACYRNSQPSAKAARKKAEELEEPN